MFSRRFLLAALGAACACLPALHDLLGRKCAADADCGDGLVCYREACAKAGTFQTVDLALSTASAEGGVFIGPAAIARTPTRPSLTAFTPGPALPVARAAAATAGGLLLGGGTGEVLGANGPTTPLPSARAAHAAIATGGHVFVLGGTAADGTALAEVLAAEQQPDGGVGGWTAQTPLPSARAGLSAVASGGAVYVLGGEGGAGLSNEVLAANVNGDGSLGAWQLIARLPEARARAGAALFDGRVYLVGGACAGACTPLRAALGSDGGLGAFETLAPLTERESPAVAVAGGALHVLGGRRGNGTLLSDSLSLPLGEDAVWQQHARLPRALYGATAWESAPGVITLAGGRGADGGVLGTRYEASATRAGADPSRDDTALPVENELGSALTWNGAVYSIGGSPRNGPLDAIHRATLLPDGGLSAWRLAGRLPEGRGDNGPVAWGGRLYLAGGCVGATACLSDDAILSADFLADGGLSAFRVIEHLPVDTAGVGVAAVGGWLYMVGGVTGYTNVRRDVWRSKLDPATGAISTPAATTPLIDTPGLWSHATVASRGFLYTVGGGNESGFGTYSDRVVAGRLAADGTVAAWSLAARLPELRGRVNALVFDDVLYVANGCNESSETYCGTQVDTVLAAPLLEDGGVGAFATVSQVGSGRRSAGAALFAGRFLTAGGYDGNPRDLVDSTLLHGRGQLGSARLVSPVSGAVAVAASLGWLYAFRADGTVAAAAPGSAWAEATPLPAARAAVAAVAQAGRLYAVGGADVWLAPVSGAQVGSWVGGPALPRVLSKPSVAATLEALYVADGTDVFRAALRGDGSLEAWQASMALPVAAERLVALDGLLVAISGDTGDVLVSTLSPLPGEWRRADGLPGPRHGFGAALTDGLLYVAGGAGLQDVLVAPVHGDGSLGAWAHVGTLPLPQAVSLVATGGQLAAVGNGVTVFGLRTAPSRGAFSMRVELGSTAPLIEAVTLKGTGVASAEVRLAGEDGVFGEWISLGKKAAGVERLLGRSARSVWLRVTLHDEAEVTSVSLATKL